MEIISKHSITIPLQSTDLYICPIKMCINRLKILCECCPNIYPEISLFIDISKKYSAGGAWPAANRESVHREWYEYSRGCLFGNSSSGCLPVDPPSHRKQSSPLSLSMCNPPWQAPALHGAAYTISIYRDVNISGYHWTGKNPTNVPASLASNTLVHILQNLFFSPHSHYSVTLPSFALNSRINICPMLPFTSFLTPSTG